MLIQKPIWIDKILQLHVGGTCGRVGQKLLFVASFLRAMYSCSSFIALRNSYYTIPSSCIVSRLSSNCSGKNHCAWCTVVRVHHRGQWGDREFGPRRGRWVFCACLKAGMSTKSCKTILYKYRFLVRKWQVDRGVIQTTGSNHCPRCWSHVYPTGWQLIHVCKCMFSMSDLCLHVERLLDVPVFTLFLEVSEMWVAARSTVVMFSPARAFWARFLTW